MDADRHALRRVNSYGPEVRARTPCLWKDRGSIIALTPDGVVLAGGGLTGGEKFAPRKNFTAASLGAGRWELGFYTERAIVSFQPPEAGSNFLAQVQAVVDRAAAKRADRHNPLRVADTDRVVQRLVYLGGAALPFEPKAVVSLVFRQDLTQHWSQIELWSHDRLFDDGPNYVFELGPRLSLEISGPGKVTTNGGFVGGGSSLQAATEGFAIASVLNGLTTKISFNTVIALADERAEGFFLDQHDEPDQIRRYLSPFFLAQRRQMHAETADATGNEKGSDSRVDLASQLTTLAELRSEGHLTEDEFAAAKRRLLSS